MQKFQEGVDQKVAVHEQSRAVLSVLTRLVRQLRVHHLVHQYLQPALAQAQALSEVVEC